MRNDQWESNMDTQNIMFMSKHIFLIFVSFSFIYTTCYSQNKDSTSGVISAQYVELIDTYKTDINIGYRLCELTDTSKLTFKRGPIYPEEHLFKQAVPTRGPLGFEFNDSTISKIMDTHIRGIKNWGLRRKYVVYGNVKTNKVLQLCRDGSQPEKLSEEQLLTQKRQMHKYHCYEFGFHYANKIDTNYNGFVKFNVLIPVDETVLNKSPKDKPFHLMYFYCYGFNHVSNNGDQYSFFTNVRKLDDPMHPKKQDRSTIAADLSYECSRFSSILTKPFFNYLMYACEEQEGQELPTKEN